MKNFTKKAAICKKAVEKWVGRVDFAGIVFYNEDGAREEGFMFESDNGAVFEMSLEAAKAGYYPAINGVRGYSVYPPEPWELEKW